MNPQIEIAINYLMHYVGIPYVWGGNNPIEGFDCSGLVVEYLKSFGVIHYTSDYTSQTLRLLCTKQFPKDDSLSRGSILFFGGGQLTVTHVAISLGHGLMLEAGGGMRSTKDGMEAARRNAFVRVRPIDYRADFVDAYFPVV